MNRAFARFAGIAIAIGACLATSVAAGGYVYTPNVTVYSSSTGGEFYGTIAAARYGSDNNQQLDCEFYYSGGPGAYCWADDAADHYVSCGTTDPNQIATLSKMSAMSYVYVQFDGNGTCTFVEVDNGSTYLH
jgi:hypothetical protein